MVMYEYITAIQKFDEGKVDLNALGELGWELVTVVVFMSNHQQFERFYFKRRPGDI